MRRRMGSKAISTSWLAGTTWRAAREKPRRRKAVEALLDKPRRDRAPADKLRATSRRHSLERNRKAEVPPRRVRRRVRETRKPRPEASAGARAGGRLSLQSF